MESSRSPRLLIDLLGIVIAGVLYYVSLQLSSSHQEITIGIATSFVFVALVDLLSVTQERLRGRDRARFFGRELVKESTTFVYPNFVLHDDVKETLVSHNQQLLFQRPLSRFSGKVVHRIDVPEVVAANDIQALLYVSSEFESTAACPNVLVADGEILRECDRSFISFGFTSNDCTHLYLHEARRPLLEIVEDGQGSEHLRLRNGHTFESDDYRQVGIILRYAPDPVELPNRRWFVVAGIGPVGTTGAGWYLARHWKTLAAKVRSDRDFVAVVSVGSYSDHTPRLEEILVDDGA